MRYYFLFLIIFLFTFSLFLLPDGDNNVDDLSHKDKESIDIGDEIGDMIMVGFRGAEIDKSSPIVSILQDLKLGGVVLFDKDVPSGSSVRNIVSPNQTEKLISDLRYFSNQPLLVAVDAEGGGVNRLSEDRGFVSIPSAGEVGRVDSPEYTQKTYEQLASQLADLDFDMNFGPVVDVDINPSNPIIGNLDRSYSADPRKVVKHSDLFIEAHNKNSILTAIKHFPGHGSSEDDSHIGLVDITDTYDKEKEIMPFKTLIAEGRVSAVMTAHVMHRDIDQDFPATLSSVFLNDWLREDLSFDGVIISDDMDMKAIVDNFGFKEAIVKSILAGVDMFIFSNNVDQYDQQVAYRAVEAIEEAVLAGDISKERIIKSSSRIRALMDN